MRGRSPTTGNTLQAGTMLAGRYQIEKVIGTGGMSVVYSARDRRFRAINRLCAVKEMFDMLGDGPARQRAREAFEREANLLASLNHHAVPKVFDYFTESERHYLVHELVEGQDLARYLHQRSRPVPPDRVIDWAIQLSQVLATLHAATPPIIFRDLKPSNVMLRPDGRIVLIDFGIAKHFQPVQKGTMIGTEGYAPPEQYEGIASPQTDIYALAATLHQLLTNTDPQEYRPFSFDQRPIRTYNQDVSPDLEAVIMRALAYDSANRWETMVAFAGALEANRKGANKGSGVLRSPERTTPIGTPNTTDKLDTPAAQGGTGLLRRIKGRDGGTRPVGPTASESGEATTFMRNAPSDGTRPVGSGANDQTRNVGHSGVTDQTKPVQPPSTPQPVQQPLRHVGGMGPTFDLESRIEGEAAYVPIWTFATEDEVRSTPAFTAESVFIGSYDTNLYCVDRATGDFRWKFATTGGIPGRPAVWQEVVMVGSEDNSVYGVNRRTGRLEWASPTRGRVRSSPTVMLDYCVIGSDDGHLYCFTAKRGHLVWKANLGAPVRSTATVGEKYIFVGTEDGTLAAVEMMSGDVMWRMRANAPIISSPALAGARVVAGSMDRTLYAADQQSGWVVWRVRLSDRIYSSPLVTDEHIFVFAVDGTLFCLDFEWGKEIWKMQLGTQTTSSPFMDENGMLYVGGGDGHLYAINPKKQKVMWKFRTGGPIPGSPRVFDGIAYFGSMDYRVYAVPTKPQPRTYG
jgi:serine/threonine protein kinase/outer membrane protein assembly factor BamB